ncbi:MAG TPA: YbaB/EbfC family nucleoid-associated protein [Phycisphaerales bacterium]|nr:YbaB/EbfC family nucleoid-associated protein [Phycisphaerales bacterium]
MFGNLGKMMKIAGEMKTKLPEMQAKLAASEFSAEAGGGAVRATVNGKLMVTDVTIDPAVLSDGELDAEMLGDLVKAAVAAAQAQAAQAAKAAMDELTGGLDLGAMGGMLGL